MPNTAAGADIGMKILGLGDYENKTCTMPTTTKIIDTEIRVLVS